MANGVTCPDVRQLGQLAAGQLPPPELDALALHLESCPACLTKVQTLTPRDTLVTALSGVRDRGPDADAEAVSRLIDKLKKFPAAAGRAETVQLACGQCSRALRVPADMAGKKVRCPACTAVLLVPGPAASPRSPEATVELSGAAHALPTGEQTVAETPAAPAAGAGEPLAQPSHLTHRTLDGLAGPDAWDFLAPPQAPGELGRLGGYRILEVLGRGGMGVVFRAEDVGLKRLVALKVMLPALAASGSGKKRFLREAQAAARLKHDHVVTIYQVAEDRGVPFLAMEFLHGEPLDVRLKRAGRLPIPEVLRLGIEVAEGLAAAHDAGLVHRDIKPANVWLETRAQAAPAAAARAKILDFGLARGDDDASELTQAGQIVGTPAYMAPEQAQGDTVDQRCDLFSLGCLLYVMGTGELPFKGKNSINTIVSVTTQEAAPPVTLNQAMPAALSDYILRLLAKNPARRPASAHEVAAALRALLAATRQDQTEEPTRPELTPAARPAAAPTRSRRGLLVACGLGLAAAILVGIVFFLPAGTGTIRVEINDDKIEVILTKTGVKIKTADKQGEIVVESGEHGLKIKRGDLELKTDQFVLKKGATIALKVEFLQGKLEVKTAAGKVLGSRTVKPSTDLQVARSNAWKPTPAQQAYLDAVAQLPLKQRLESVTRKIQELNRTPSTNDPVELVLEPKEGLPTRCRIPQGWTHDIWPLAALTSLTAVDLSATNVVDFRPLSRLPLAELQVKLILDNLASEEALRSLTALKKVNDRPAAEFWSERAEIRKEIDKMAAVSSGLPLEDQQTWVRRVMRKLHPKVPEGAFNALSVGKSESGLVLFRGHGLHAGVFDFAPVRALPVEEFILVDGNLFDATPLGKTKLKVLVLNGGNAVRDLSPLAGLPLTHLHFAGTPVDLKPLAGMKLKTLSIGGTDLTPLRDMPLEALDIRGVSDLSPLQGMPLKRLSMGNYCPASDLSPLKGMPLEVLTFDRSKVSDLSPLAGMKLKELAFWGSPVTDLTPLKDMPLTQLNISRAYLSPVLATMPLKELELEFRLHYEPDEKILRTLKLEKINGMTPDDFWKDVDKRRKADAETVARFAKMPLEPKELEKALWEECGQYPKVKIEDGAVVEASAGHSGKGVVAFMAFPRLRKLSTHTGGDYSPLLKLPLLEEFDCPEQELRMNLPALKRLPKLKKINGRPAKDVFSSALMLPRWPFDPPDGKVYVWSNPKLLGGDVNTDVSELLWGVGEDERTLYFCRDRPLVGARQRLDEAFSKGVVLDGLNPIESQGAVSANGLAVVVGRLSKKNKADGEWELWFSSRRHISLPFPAPKYLGKPVNADGSAMHPVLSADGLTLLICSNRTGSDTGDIWMFTRDAIDAPFARGEQLPEPINTPDWDMPYHVSNDRLFLIASRQFVSSEGKAVREVRYFRRARESDPWGPGIPLGIPLGAAEDSDTNAGFRLSGDGRTIYFSSSVLPNGRGDDDIWVSRRVLKRTKP